MLSEKVLIIDDDIRVIKSLRMILDKYDLVEFMDGTEAIRYLEKPRDIYLTLLDVMMPQIDGLNVLCKIKEMRPDMAVIIMTAYATKDVAVQALRYHADDFIEKPFNYEELNEKVLKVLTEKAHLNKNAATKSYRINKIKNFVKRNYKKASLKSVSEEMRLSPKYLSRIFKEQEKRSFREYLLDAKMDEAKYLLMNSKITVDELSYFLGYQNPESFMRIFKKIQGLTPTQYRNQAG